MISCRTDLWHAPPCVNESSAFVGLQISGAQVSITVEGFEPGARYRLSFFTAARVVRAEPSAAQLSVYINGSVVYRSPDQGETTNFQQKEAEFSALEETLLIAFRNTGTPGFDQTIFVDDVRVASISPDSRERAAGTALCRGCPL